MQVTTIAERKANEAERRARAADAVVADLAAFVREHEGTFTIFGSYVTRTMRFDSDLDILIDFSDERSGEAWRFVEASCALHGVPADIHEAQATTLRFLERVRGKGIVIS